MIYSDIAISWPEAFATIRLFGISSGLSQSTPANGICKSFRFFDEDINLKIPP